MPREPHSMRWQIYFYIKGICIVAALILAGCAGGTEVGNPEAASGFASDQAVEQYIKSQYATNILPANTYDTVEQRDAVDDAYAPSSDAAGNETARYSETNLQEAGVDESDCVKTDGVFFYVASRREIRIIQAMPADAMAVVSRIAVKGVMDSLYLYGNILVALYTPDGGSGETWSGTHLQGVADIGCPYWLPVNRQSGILIADIRDPAHPRTLKTITIDGNMVSSRRLDGNLHIIHHFLPDLPPLKLWYDGTEKDRKAAIESNRIALAPLSLADLIPSCALQNTDGETIETKALLSAADFVSTDETTGGSIVTVTTIDLDTADFPLHSTGFIGDVHYVYASVNSLYLAATSWNYQPWREDASGAQIHTILHRLSLAGGAVRYEAGGQIKGQLLNQFSMGEYENVLRVATSTGWGADTRNYVFCLARDADRLSTIGSLSGIAPGENLYAARFIGPRGFIVTFVTVDPLFTLDLSDPTRPVIAGELKVPGYSDYIHPMDENHLLTIGKDVIVSDGSPYYQGVRLSVFDISDFQSPRLLHSRTIGDRGTESEALYNHKAFTFFEPGHLMALPIQLYTHDGAPETPWEYGTHTFSGLYVYRVTAESGFEEMGRLPATAGRETMDDTNPEWTRGVFIDRHVFSVTPHAVASAAWSDIPGTTHVLAP